MRLFYSSKHEKRLVGIENHHLLIAIAALLLIETLSQLLFASFVNDQILRLGFNRFLETCALVMIIGFRKQSCWHGLRLGTMRFSFFLSLLMILLAIGLKRLGPQWMSLFVREPMAPSVSTILLFFTTCLMAPLAEELFFRGFLFGFFRRFGCVVALGVSSLLFAAFHAVGPALPVIPFIGGLVCALAYEYDGNLMSPFLVHGTGNFLFFFVLLPPL